MNPSEHQGPLNGDELLPPEPEEGWELRAAQHRSDPQVAVRLAATLNRCHLVRRLKGDSLAWAMDHEGVAGQFQPGDEIWWWSKGGFSQLAGRAGYALRRQSKIVGAWLVVMN